MDVEQIKKFRDKIKEEQTARDLSGYFTDMSEDDIDKICSLLYTLEHDEENDAERHKRFVEWLDSFGEDDVRAFAVFGLKCHKLCAQMNARLNGKNCVWDEDSEEVWYLDTNDGTYKQWHGEDAS